MFVQILPKMLTASFVERPFFSQKSGLCGCSHWKCITLEYYCFLEKSAQWVSSLWCNHPPYVLWLSTHFLVALCSFSHSVHWGAAEELMCCSWLFCSNRTLVVICCLRWLFQLYALLNCFQESTVSPNTSAFRVKMSFTFLAIHLTIHLALDRNTKTVQMYLSLI